MNTIGSVQEKLGGASLMCDKKEVLMAKKYTIKDKEGRVWGEFEVLGEMEGSIYGYLSTTNDFDKVKQIFIEHDAAISGPNGDTDVTSKRIIDLGAYLVDGDTKEDVDIGNVIFVNEDLLVTCEPHKI